MKIERIDWFTLMHGLAYLDNGECCIVDRVSGNPEQGITVQDLGELPEL